MNTIDLDYISSVASSNRWNVVKKEICYFQGCSYKSLMVFPVCSDFGSCAAEDDIVYTIITAKTYCLSDTKLGAFKVVTLILIISLLTGIVRSWCNEKLRTFEGTLSKLTV